MKERLKRYYVNLVKRESQGAPEALLCFVLLLFSFVYGFLVKLILSCYETGLCKSVKPRCKIIGVGNITWGGTGKTSLTESLARYFQQIGRIPAVLMRGYGNDEALMLKGKLKDIPVLAGRNRIGTAKAALERYNADTLILDDGFQHWRLGRDLDIVLIDATCPFGNDRLIPRGLLREPLSSLARADILVLTNAASQHKDAELIKQKMRRYNSQAPIFEANYRPIFLRSLASGEEVELSKLKNEQIAAVCGIASPRSFINLLTLLGAQICLKFCFSDHFQYRKKDLEIIERQCLNKQISTVVTTEKDAPKLSRLLKSYNLKINLLALCAEFKIVKDEERLFHFLLAGKDNNTPYSILILNDGRAGHLNQAKAVAKIIRAKRIEQALDSRVDTKIVEVRFKNTFFRVLLSVCSVFSGPYCGRCLQCLRICLDKSSYVNLLPTPADIVISAGSSLSAVNLFTAYKNKAKKIVLMKPPFWNLNKFDLAIIPEHDRLRAKDNVLVTKITPNLIDQQYLEEQAGILRNRLEAGGWKLEAGRLTIGVFIGGDTPKYKLTAEIMDRVIAQLKEVAAGLNSRLLITTSRRTPKGVEKSLKENLVSFNNCKLLVIANERNIAEAVGGILGLSDIVVVSGESISMVSEAISAGKYVLVFLPQKTVRSLTKQERFLQKLEAAKFIRKVEGGNLSNEIERIWKEKPEKKKMQDKDLILEAITKLFLL